jgi:hypothetical protein
MEVVTRVVFVWLGLKEQFPSMIGGLGFLGRAKKVRVGGRKGNQETAEVGYEGG